VKAFQFEKALMQEHFNENYMESSKYPKATFKGDILNFKEFNFSKDGTYPAKVKGTMTIHGVSKPMETTAQFTVKKGAISGASEFKILVADYGIKIPSLVKDKIAKEVKIDIKADYQPLK
jgi:polyisoprenoid-binding protein YceI